MSLPSSDYSALTLAGAYVATSFVAMYAPVAASATRRKAAMNACSI